MTGDWQTVCFCPAADHPHHHGEGECPNGLAYIAAPRRTGSSPSDDVKYAVDTHPGHDVERAYIATLEEQGVLTEAQADDLRWLVDDGADRVIAYERSRQPASPDLRALDGAMVEAAMQGGYVAEIPAEVIAERLRAALGEEPRQPASPVAQAAAGAFGAMAEMAIDVISRAQIEALRAPLGEEPQPSDPFNLTSADGGHNDR